MRTRPIALTLHSGIVELSLLPKGATWSNEMGFYMRKPLHNQDAIKALGLIMPNLGYISQGGHVTELMICRLPVWVPTSILVGLFIVLRGQREKTPTSRCLACNYSLVGNTTGICPECGTVIPEDQRARLEAPDGPESGVLSSPSAVEASGDSMRIADCKSDGSERRRESPETGG